MTEFVVATYKDATTLKNTEEDLRATGIPIEKIKVDYDHSRIRVMVPGATKDEVLEILNRHEPAEVR
jgi:hypothetical protein